MTGGRDLRLVVLGTVFGIFDLARSLKHGAAWIQFDRFPFFLGEALEARLGCRGPLSRFRKVTVTLRFVREYWQRRGYGSRRSSALACRQHWADTREYGHEQIQMLSELPVRFDLPTGDYSTQDARVRYTLGDGRAFLMRGARRDDVIEADALLPNAAFAGSLYSRDYFELLRGRLKPGASQ